MSKRIPLVLVLALAAGTAQAQTNPAPAAGKKELAARIVRLQQPAIEGMARAMAEQPAAELMNRAGAALQARVAPERREAVGRELQADVKRYLDEAVPLVQSRAVKLAPQTIGALLEERLSEDELRQVVTVLESPAWGKFQQLGGEMQNALTERLLAETRASIEPRIAVLEQSMSRRLGLGGTGSAKTAPKPARAASQ